MKRTPTSLTCFQIKDSNLNKHKHSPVNKTKQFKQMATTVILILYRLNHCKQKRVPLFQYLKSQIIGENMVFNENTEALEAEWTEIKSN
jgi:hypothetical protein